MADPKRALSAFYQPAGSMIDGYNHAMRVGVPDIINDTVKFELHNVQYCFSVGCKFDRCESPTVLMAGGIEKELLPLMARDANIT